MGNGLVRSNAARLSLAALCTVAACGRAPVPSSGDAAGSTTTASAVVEVKPDASAAVPVSASYDGARPSRAKSIGHTSVVFRLVFADGRKAAFKPRSQRGKARYKGEIAGHRLATALGLPNVPTALPFRVRAEDLRLAAESENSASAALVDKEVVAGADGFVSGALMPWLDRLDFPALEGGKARAGWEPWVFGNEAVPEGEKIVAADLSTMIAFDTITGNWDRWSGANIGRSDPAGHLLFVDNDGAFFDPAPPGPLARQKALLMRVRRFSKSFVDKLRTLDEAQAFGEERPGEPLLSPAVLKSVAARRVMVLGVIDEKIRSGGEAATLAFP
jgi:hypothetical protein